MTKPVRTPSGPTPGASPQHLLLLQAEAALASRKAPSLDVESLSPAEVRELVHNLRVHQIELELQNEQLLEAQLLLHAARANYLQLYETAPVGYCVLSEDGLVLQANMTAGTLLGTARETLEGEPWTRWIATASQDDYYFFRRAVTSTGGPRSCELRMVKEDQTDFLAHLTATSSLNADGKPVLRVVVSDITSLAEALRGHDGDHGNGSQGEN